MPIRAPKQPPTPQNHRKRSPRQQRDSNKTKVRNVRRRTRHPQLTRRLRLRQNLPIQQIMIRGNHPPNHRQRHTIAPHTFISSNQPHHKQHHQRIHTNPLIPTQSTRRILRNLTKIQTTQHRHNRLPPSQQQPHKTFH